MSRVSSVSSSEIQDIVGEFVGQLSALVEQDALSRAREAIMLAFSGGDGGAVTLPPGPKRRGRPPGRRTGVLEPTVVAKRGPIPGRKRRKAPIQLCPVPGCTNRAAPVFGMVCSDHKGLPKSQIKKFREARRAQKGDGAGDGGGKARSLSAKKSAKKPRVKAKTKARKPVANIKKRATKRLASAPAPRPVASKPDAIEV
jgi:hypothetical protein